MLSAKGPKFPVPVRGALFAAAVTAMACAPPRAPSPRSEPGPARFSRPGWVDSPAATPYSRDRYLVGTGAARSTGSPAGDQQAADYEAFAAIANQIVATVHADVSLEQAEITRDSLPSFSSAARASVRLSSTLTLAGLTVVERFYDPERLVYYSLAVLDLDAATAPVRARLSELSQMYRRSLESGRELCAKGAVRPCLSLLRQAQDYASTFQETVRYYRLLRPRDVADSVAVPNPAPGLPGEIAVSTLGGLTLEKIGGDSQAGVIGRPLPQPLQVRAYVMAGTGKVPAEGLVVRFRFADGAGEMDDAGVTDASGTAAAVVHRLERSATGSYSISATLDLGAELDSLPAGWTSLRALPSPSVLFRVTLKKAPAPLKILVLVEQPEAARIISAELVRAGFDALSESDVDRALSVRVRRFLSQNQYEELARALSGSANLVVLGTVETAPRGEYQGLRIFEASGWVKAVSIPDARSLAENVARDVRGFGANDSQAQASAFRAGAQQLAEALVAELLSRM